MKSIKNGYWFDASVWDGNRAPNETEDIEFAHLLTYDKNIVRRAGILKSRGGELKGINVKEISFVGTIDGQPDLQTSDVGIWILDNAQVDLEGAPIKAWTNANGSLLKGTTSFSVKDASGWLAGHEIVIVPTDTPPEYGQDWNDSINKPIDPFLEKFERRIIKSISGNTITIDPLLYDHLVDVTPERTRTPEVANNTGTVKISGTPTGRPHVFIKSSKPQNIRYVEFSLMGPRSGTGRTSAVLGRYALHFHHCSDGSRGSMIVGNKFHDNGNRVFVPHGSHGISAVGNSSLFFQNDNFWYDPGHVTHDLLYDGNLLGGVVYHGQGSNTMGMQLGQGDDNIARNNVCVYNKAGEVGTGGDYAWNADNESRPWVFENNLSHSSTTGLFNWQNSAHDHLVITQDIYNCVVGALNGAYINSYNFEKCILHNAIWRQKATPGNNTPMFDRCVFDGAGKIPFLVQVDGSPVPAGIPNSFVNCVFRNYTDTAFLMNTHFLAAGEVATKAVDIILSTFTGPITKFDPASIFNSYFRIQPISGQSVKVTQQGTSNIAPFAAVNYGNGTGLLGEYYNGSNFESFAFKRLDTMIKFQQWSVSPFNSPNGVDHRITGDAFSVRWTGFIEAQFSESTQIVMQSDGGVRVWIDNKLILDRWVESSGLVNVYSSPVPMVAKQKYAIKIEHMNQGGARACLLHWKSPSMTEVRNVPMAQLYPGTVVTPPPPPIKFKSAAITGSYTRNNCLPTEVGTAVAVNIPQGAFEADDQITADNLAKAEAQKIANTTGICKLITPPPMPDPCTTFVAADYLELQPDVKAAGYTLTTAINHYNTYGIKEKRRANKLCLDPLLFPKLIPIPPPVPVVEIFTAKSGKEYTLETNGTLKPKP